MIIEGHNEADRPMYDYTSVFLQAVKMTLDDYRTGMVRFLSEADLQSHLFYWCRVVMEKGGYPKPLKLFALRSVFDRRSKIDLVLGDDEVLVELKMEPDYPGVSKPVVFSTKREAQGSGSIEEDLEKIHSYSVQGKQAHFFMIDEDGRHKRRIDAEWKEVRRPAGISFYLHSHREPVKR